MELILFIIYGAIANAFAGGKIQPVLKQHGGPLPGRGIYYAGLLSIVLGMAFYGLPGALAGFSFLLWRLPGWYGSIDAGLDPYNPERDGWNIRNQRARDFIVMSARGLVAFPVFAYLVYDTGNWGYLIPLVLGSVAQGAAYDLAHRGLNRNNLVAELLSGAIWGVVYWTVLS